MVKKASRPTSRHHIMLYEEDYEYLNDRFGVGGPRSELGLSGAIRAIVHQRVIGMKAREAKKVDQLRDEDRDPGEEGVRLEGGT